MGRKPRYALLRPGVHPREVWAWAMYDFANSGYTTVVITAIFNAYFVGVVAGNAPWATLAWSLALGVSYALVMVSAPAIGAYADLRSAKKRLLAFATLGCALATAALAWVGPGEFWLAVSLVVVSNFFFGTGENLIAAFLPELARGRAMARLSGWGWGLGYVGGMLTLGLCLGYIHYAQRLGEEATDYVPATMVLTAGIFLAASLPTFLFLRERPTGLAAERRAIVGAYRELQATLRQVGAYTDLFRFLLCIVCYQAGVQAVIALAAVYAQQAMGFDTQTTLLLILVVNVVAALGAVAFGYVQDRIGHKAGVAVTLIGWLLTVLLAWSITDPRSFWLVAHLAGLCLGASQSAGRALVGYLSPLPHRAQFFGLWGLAVKLASILGPITYGAAVWLAAGAHRGAMLSLGCFFLLGLLLLAGVDVSRGRRHAILGARRERDRSLCAEKHSLDRAC